MVLTQRDAVARHLAAIVESSDDAIVSKDLNGLILSWNRAAARMFGYTAEDIVGKSVRLIVPEDRWPEDDDVLARIRRGEKTEHFETVRRRKDGSLVPVAVTVSPIRNEHGEVIGASKILRDLSERKHAETALDAAEAARLDLQRRLLALVAASRSLVGTPDVDAVVAATVRLADQLVSADAYAVWRLEQGAAAWTPILSINLSRSFLDLAPEGTSGAPRPLAFTEPQVVRDVRQDERLMHRHDAYEREGVRALLIIPMSVLDEWTAALVFYYRTPHEFSHVDVETARALGNLAAAALTTAELYARQHRQQRRAEFLAEAAARLAGSLDYRQTLTAVANLVVPSLADWCAIDLIGDEGALDRLAIAHAKPHMRDLAEQLVTRWPDIARAPNAAAAAAPILISEITDEMLVAGSAGDAERLRRVRELGVRSYMRVPLLTRDGVIGAINLANSESPHQFTEEDVRFAQDLAARAAMAVENARAYEEARRANRVKDDFLATLSHELRTPLNAILGYARMLRTKSIPETRKDHGLLVIERNATALAQIVGDVLDVSRIVAGKLRLAFQPLDLRDVLHDAADTVSHDAQVRGVTLVLPELPAPLLVRGDAARLQQVFWNLLSNAIKFTPAGGEVRVSLTRDDHRLVLAVRDTGVGIAPAFLPHIFEPFQQADSKPSREFGGLGLGLAIVRRLVEMHGGAVDVASDGVGRGSEFRVTLPAG